MAVHSDKNGPQEDRRQAAADPAGGGEGVRPQGLLRAPASPRSPSGREVADGTIYLYFRNKEDILVSLFDEVMAEHLRAGRARSSARSTGAPAGCWPSPRTTCACWAATATWRWSSRSSCASPPSSWSASPPPGCRTTSRCSSEVIEEGQREGTLRPDLPLKVVTKAFFGALDEMVTSWIIGGKDYDLAQLAAPVVDLFLRGAAAPGRPRGPRRPSRPRRRRGEAGDGGPHPLRHLLHVRRHLPEARRT